LKKIIGYRKMLGVDEKAGLKELKTAYRNLMKEWHPDKFQDSSELEVAQEKSKKVIEAYHFLVSISPETHAASLEEYTNIITSSTIVDYNYKGANLQITYAEGNCYEYFDVPRSLYIKLVNADTPGRFARRHICGSFIYREISKATSVV
jgi:curved DNA-binding protein CbpA